MLDVVLNTLKLKTGYLMSSQNVFDQVNAQYNSKGSIPKSHTCLFSPKMFWVGANTQEIVLPFVRCFLQPARCFAADANFTFITNFSQCF